MTHRIAISVGALGLLFAACSSSSDSPPTGASYTNESNVSSNAGSGGNASSDAGSSSSPSTDDPSSSNDDPSSSSSDNGSSSSSSSTDAGSSGSSSRSRNNKSGSSSGTDAGTSTGTADAAANTDSDAGTSKGSTTDAGTDSGSGKASTADAGSGSSGGGNSGGTANCASGLCGPVISGHATWFDAHGTLNCSFPAFTDWMVGAPSLAHYYNGGKACGECIQATGKKGTVTIRVVDSCPDCDKRSPAADLDLSEEAFQLVDDLNAGYVPITFQVVPCDVNGPMQYRFKDGSTQSWTAIQVLNNREPLSTFEYQNSKGTWVQMYLSAQSNSDSFFTASNGVGALNPLTVRITSVYGQVVVDTINVNIGNSAINSNTIFTGTQQFE